MISEASFHSLQLIISIKVQDRKRLAGVDLRSQVFKSSTTDLGDTRINPRACLIRLSLQSVVLDWNPEPLCLPQQVHLILLKCRIDTD